MSLWAILSSCEVFFIFSKDKEIVGLQQKVEEDASEVAALQKKIRELEAKISELEEDLENERVARSRVCVFVCVYVCVRKRRREEGRGEGGRERERERNIVSVYSLDYLPYLPISSPLCRLRNRRMTSSENWKT